MDRENTDLRSSAPSNTGAFDERPCPTDGSLTRDASEDTVCFGASPSTSQSHADAKKSIPVPALVAAVVCLVLVVGSGGYFLTHPDAFGAGVSKDAFQTVADDDAPKDASAHASGDDALGDTAAEADGGDGPVPSDSPAPASGEVGGEGSRSSSTTGNDATYAASQGSSSQDGGAAATGGSDSGQASAPSQGHSSQPAPQGGGDAPAPEAPKTITVRVIVDSSAVGSPVSSSKSLTFDPGATAYDALCGLGLSVNARGTSFGVYVAGIGGLAEKDHGPQSGWKYMVNGSYPNYTADSCELHDGDTVTWVYALSA